MIRITVEPILVGRNADKLAALAAQHGVADYTTSLDEALTDDSATIYFDAQVTSERKKAILKAVGAGKHIYTEKPIAESVAEGIELVNAAREAGVINGVVHDKLYLPGLVKLKRLIDSGFFGRILSVRGEFGYWVFEGDLVPAQRPSWNYRAEDGGGIVLDMFPHWNYVLENLFGRVQAVTAKAVTHIPERWDEQGRTYAATADDAAYAIFELDGDILAQVNSSWAVRVDRGELVEFQVDGTHGSAVAGLFGCRIQPRVSTPMPVWNPDLPTTEDFRSQWTADPGQRRVHQRVPGAVGAVPGRCRRRPCACRTISPPAYAGCSSPTPVWSPRRRAPGRDRLVRVMTQPRTQRGTRSRRPPPRLRCPTPTADGGRSSSPSRDAGRTIRTGFGKRIAFAAAHVVADPRGENVPGAPAVVDWDATLAFRTHLFRYGLGVAEAMDTAQRNMGLDWPATQELITRSAALAREHGARIASGAGTDQLLRPGRRPERGHPGLPRAGRVRRGRGLTGDRDGLPAPGGGGAQRRGLPLGLRAVLAQASRPVILHWLGEMFDPQLSGYWGSVGHRRPRRVRSWT